MNTIAVATMCFKQMHILLRLCSSTLLSRRRRHLADFESPFLDFYLRAFFASVVGQLLLHPHLFYGGQSAIDLQLTKQDRLQTVVTTCTAVTEEGI